MSYEVPQQILRWANLPECESPAEGWQVRRFTEIAKVIAGQSPPSETYNEKGDGLAFLQGNADFSFKHPIPELWCSSPAKIAKIGDTLISVRAPVGEINRADQDYAIGRGLAAIRATNANPDFIYQALQRWRWSLQRVAQGTTFDAVTARHFSQLRVAIPENIDEQAAIAHILDAVDTTIERTREAVEGARILAQSLAQNLLECGIDETGVVRSREDAKTQFYATELGLLPKNWIVQRLADVADIERGRFSPRPRNDPRFYNGPFPFVQTGQIARAKGRVITDFAQTLNVQGKAVSREFPAGTVIITIAANIGETAILGIPMCAPDSLVGVMVKASHSPRFVELCLRRLRPKLLALAPRSAQANINLKTLKPLRIPVPPPAEQKKIAAIFDAAETKVMALEAKRAALQQLKKSLMHDLLTGKVRVDLSHSGFQVPASFFEPLPDDLLDAFEGRQ